MDTTLTRDKLNSQREWEREIGSYRGRRDKRERESGRKMRKKGREMREKGREMREKGREMRERKGERESGREVGVAT